MLVDGDSGVTAVLACGWDQIWRGHWTRFECMPIDLASLREPQGPDATLARARGDGMHWLVDDQIPESAIGLRNHEDWIWQHIPTGRDVVIVDVGAFVGTFAVWASRRCRKVIAFEPHPKHHALLRRNLILNDCENVVPVEAAVGEVEAKVSMGDPDLAAHVLANYGSGFGMQLSYELTFDACWWRGRRRMVIAHVG